MISEVGVIFQSYNGVEVWRVPWKPTQLPPLPPNLSSLISYLGIKESIDNEFDLGNEFSYFALGDFACFTCLGKSKALGRDTARRSTKTIERWVSTTLFWSSSADSQQAIVITDHLNIWDAWSHFPTQIPIPCPVISPPPNCPRWFSIFHRHD